MLQGQRGHATLQHLVPNVKCAFRATDVDISRLISHILLALLGDMAWFVRNKERERFYLLPGMGGKNLRRKRKRIMQWSIAAGLLTSAALAYVLFLISQRH